MGLLNLSGLVMLQWKEDNKQGIALKNKKNGKDLLGGL